MINARAGCSAGNYCISSNNGPCSGPEAKRDTRRSNGAGSNSGPGPLFEPYLLPTMLYLYTVCHLSYLSGDLPVKYYPLLYFVYQYSISPPPPPSELYRSASLPLPVESLNCRYHTGVRTCGCKIIVCDGDNRDRLKIYWPMLK